MAHARRDSPVRNNRRARDDSPTNETRRSHYSDLHRSRTDRPARSPTRRREEAVDSRAKRRSQERVSNYGLERGRNFDRDLPRRIVSPPAQDRSEENQPTLSHSNRPIDAEPSRSSKRRRTRSPSPLPTYHRSHQSPLRNRNRGHSRERWNQHPKLPHPSEGKSRRPNSPPRAHHSNPFTTTEKSHHTHQARHQSRSPHRLHSPNSQRWGRSPSPEFRHRRKRNRNRRRHRSSSRQSNRSNVSYRAIAPPSRQHSPASQHGAGPRGQSHTGEEKDDMDNNRGRQSYPGQGMSCFFSTKIMY